MRKIKYFTTILIFCTMVFVCYRAINNNLISHASNSEGAEASNSILSKLDIEDTVSDIADELNSTLESNESDTDEAVDNSDISASEDTESSESVSDESTSEESSDEVVPEEQTQSFEPATDTSSQSTNTTTSTSTDGASSTTSKSNKSGSTSKKTTSTQSTSASTSSNSTTTISESNVASVPAAVQQPVTPVATPAPIVIPTIYSPSTPGSVIYSASNSTAVIDASNSSQGYIGIKYSGSNWKVKVQISANGNTYNYDLPSNGEYVIYPLQFGNGDYTISVLENVSGNQYMGILSQTISVGLSNSSLVYLYPNQYVWFTQNSAVVKKSGEVCAGLTRDIDKVAAIFQYVSSNLTYDYAKANSVQSGYLPDVDTILASRTGICFDYAAVFAAMCRAQGIPCKLVTGYVSNGQYHAWNEVYVNETGSVTSTLYLDKVGYNRLDPTFYSSMNASSAASYIKNNSNYSNYHVY